MLELPIDRPAPPRALVFFVPGKPQTAGSKSSGVAHRYNKETGKHEPVRRGDGKLVTFTRESGSTEARAQKQTWRGDLRDAALVALAEVEGVHVWPAPKGEALEVRFVAVRKRPSEQLRSGKHEGEVKDWALALRPTKTPDATKLLRAAEDALKGVLYDDDAQIVEVRCSKVFGDQVGLSVRSEGMIVVLREGRPYSGPRVALG